MPKLVTAYRFDSEGYYIGPDQVMPGILPADDTMDAPEEREGYWPRYVDGAWTYEKIPTTAEDLADVVVDHQSHTKHAEALRKLMRSLVPSERTPGQYALEQEQGTNNLKVVLVPELTEAEKQLEEDEAAGRELDSQIYALKDQMAYAMLTGDQVWIADLRAEYRALMGIEED